MYVVATAGHVDHGKSTLLRELTGMEPDRWAQERARGMTIDLGYVWTALPTGQTVAFVDVPGHERFLGNMLAGVGPVPAVLFVVAADEGWMPQSTEHLSALDALGVRHGLLVVTRSDLAEPEWAAMEAREHLAGTSLAGIPWVGVSAVTGTGLAELRTALGRLVDSLPQPDPLAPVRLWLDRAFVIRGSGTVVTGTLGAGTLRIGDELELPGAGRVRVRGLQALHRTVDEVRATARVAVSLRGGGDRVRRGAALLTPGRWWLTDQVDVRLEPARSGPDGDVPVAAEVSLHIGSARVAARVRPLGGDAGGRGVARLSLDSPLPLHVGDRALLRDPNLARGRRIVATVTVLDACPPALRRRGAAAQRGRQLAALPGVPAGEDVLRLRGVARAADLRAMGCTVPEVPEVAGWLLDPGRRTRLGTRLRDVVARYLAERPLEPGMPVEAARRALGLPDRRIVESFMERPLCLRDGRICDGERDGGLPDATRAAIDRLCAMLATRPFHAPEADDLVRLGLDRPALAAAERSGSLLRVGDGVVLLPDADHRAVAVLRRLTQPFTTSQARQALDTTRRVVIPLLEHLDRRGLTERVDTNLRRLRPGQDSDRSGGVD